MKFACPHCTGHLDANVELAGMQVTCPHCQTTIVVPGVAVRIAPPSEPITHPPAGRITRRRSSLLAPSIAGGLALLVVLAVWLFIRRPTHERVAGAETISESERAMGTKKRDSVEVTYIENLLKTRKTMLAVNECWEALLLANQFPYGPHFKGMQYDEAMVELKKIQSDIGSFEPTMNTFNSRLNELYQSGAAFVEVNPDFKENNDRIRLPQTVKFTIGDLGTKIALKDLQNAIEHALTVLDVNYSKSS